MIIDTKDNIQQYKGIVASLDLVIQFIMKEDLTQLPLGKTVISDDAFILAFDNVMQETDKTPFEMHRKWGDLHISQLNKECIKCAPLSHITMTTEFDESTDVGFGECSDYYDVIVDPEHFVIVFPNDAHSVKNYAKDTQVKKLVFKFKL